MKLLLNMSHLALYSALCFLASAASWQEPLLGGAKAFCCQTRVLAYSCFIHAAQVSPSDLYAAGNAAADAAQKEFTLGTGRFDRSADHDRKWATKPSH